MKKNVIWLLVALVVIVGGIYTYNKQNQNEDVIKIGAILPLTDNAAGLGNSTKEGIELAIEDYNSLNQKKVVCDFYDSKGKPSESSNFVNKIIYSKPKFIYSIVSGVSMAVLPFSEENKIVHIGAVGAVNFVNDGEYSIRNYVEPDKIGKKIAELTKDELDSKNLGIFYSNNEYGLSIKNSFVNQTKLIGLNLVFEESYDDNNLNYRNNILKAITNKNIETIYIVGVGKSLGTLLKQLRESGYKGNVVGDIVFPYPDVITAAGDFSKGVYYLDFDFDKKKDKVFFEKYQKRFGKEPTNFAAIAYNATKISLDSQKEGKELLNFLNDNKSFEGVFGNFEFKNRNFNYSLKLKKYE